MNQVYNISFDSKLLIYYDNERQHVANFGNRLTHDTTGDENVIHFQI